MATKQLLQRALQTGATPVQEPEDKKPMAVHLQHLVECGPYRVILVTGNIGAINYLVVGRDGLPVEPAERAEVAAKRAYNEGRSDPVLVV